MRVGVKKNLNVILNFRVMGANQLQHLNIKLCTKAKEINVDDFDYEYTIKEKEIYCKVILNSQISKAWYTIEPNPDHIYDFDCDYLLVTYFAGCLRYIKNQTPELCSNVVNINGFEIRHVKNQTPEMCYDALEYSPMTLRFIKIQTPELCFYAIRHDANTFKYVKTQTPHLCEMAVGQNGRLLRYVKKQTPEICINAVRQNGHALRYVKNQTPEICEEAIEQCYSALRYVRDPDIKNKLRA